MTDHYATVIRELMEMTGYTQSRLAKEVGTSQSNISKWLAGTQQPNTKQWEPVQRLYVELRGETSIDARIAAYDPDTKRVINEMIDNYLRLIPPPRRR